MSACHIMCPLIIVPLVSVNLSYCMAFDLPLDVGDLDRNRDLAFHERSAGSDVILRDKILAKTHSEIFVMLADHVQLDCTIVDNATPGWYNIYTYAWKINTSVLANHIHVAGAMKRLPQRAFEEWRTSMTAVWYVRVNECFATAERCTCCVVSK